MKFSILGKTKLLISKKLFHGKRPAKIQTLCSFSFLCSVFLLILTRCSLISSISSPTPTPMAIPTATNVISALPTLEEKYSKSNTPSPISMVTPNLSTRVYIHPNNLFYLLPPEGWIAIASEDSVKFYNPTGFGFLNVFVVNVGFDIDLSAFEKLVNNRELNMFSNMEGYIPVSPQLDSERRSAKVIKRVEEDSKPITIISNYLLEDSWVCILEWELQPEDALPIDEIINERMIQSLRLNKQSAANLKVYDIKYHKPVMLDYFSYNVPIFWSEKQSSGQNTIVVTYSSPDEHAWVQSLVFNDETAISKRVAGLVTLFLLNNYYTKDIVITSDQIFPDGRERLVWYSPSGKYRGISYFASNPPAFLLHSVVYDEDYGSIYLPVLDEVSKSFLINPIQPTPTIYPN